VKVAVVDHGMGNLRSVARALEAAGADVEVTGDPSAIARREGLCVPGQGIFGRCMASVSTSGIADTVRDFISRERPFLGICLGMQILFDSSEEDDAPGLGLVPGKVVRLPATVTVPHIGWNEVDDDYYYFDHSYAAHPQDDRIVSGWCEHGERFAASIQKGSLFACQFHPEKSGRAGIRSLEEWIKA
jgi:imidazole glycerol-phosphate synthase subunit HisH